MNDRQRSDYVRRLVQEGHRHVAPLAGSTIPRVLVQFWDDLTRLPADVRECLNSWRPLDRRDVVRLLFDDKEARLFIADHYGLRHSAAFEQCLHPAMRCDYFRLCYMAKKGGFYVDADEYYQCVDVESLFEGDSLKVQPLCYDRATGTMVRVEVFTSAGADSGEWIFYVNNNPLIAPPNHPILRGALARSTSILLSQEGTKRDIQSITGPGNLTATLVSHALSLREAAESRDFEFVTQWEQFSVSPWPLSYRGDERNWRLWAGQVR